MNDDRLYHLRIAFNAENHTSINGPETLHPRGIPTCAILKAGVLSTLLGRYEMEIVSNEPAQN